MKAITFFCIGLLAASSAIAEPIPYQGEGNAKLPKRLAVVVGVEKYNDGGSFTLKDLSDAATDATAMANFLPSLGFEQPLLVVGTPQDLFVTKQKIEAAINDLKQKAITAKQSTGRAPILLFYFAGHGFSLDGANYILPSNFSAFNHAQVKNNAIALSDVVSSLQEAEPALQIIITDSCRSVLSVNVSGANGLAKSGVVEPSNGWTVNKEEFGKNRIIFLYSALSGSPAYGTGNGGRFTRAFQNRSARALHDVQNDDSKKVSLQEIFERTRQDMLVDAQAAQKWQKAGMDNNLGSTFYPLPTITYFNVEKSSFQRLKKIEPGIDDIELATDRRICNLRDLLFQVSEYSYFSKRIIDEMYRPESRDPLDCDKVQALGGGRGGVEPPTRNLQNKIQVPAVSPSISKPTDGGARQPNDGALQYHQTKIASLETPDASPIAYPVARDSLRRIAQLPVEKGTEEEKSRNATTEDGKARPNFGSITNALENWNIAPNHGTLPEGNVPLDQAVVAKSNAFLRAGPSNQTRPINAVPPGEILQVIAANRGQWLLVRHTTLGTGYISGELVESALMKLSKSVKFEPRQFELSDDAKNELLASYGLLGGVAVVDAAVDFPLQDGSVGFARASDAAQFVREIVAGPRGPSERKIYVPVRPNDGKQDPVDPNSVRVTLLALPLDQETRAALAQKFTSGSRVDLNVAPSPQEVTPKGSQNLELTVCRANSSDCGKSASVPNARNQDQKFKEEIGKAINQSNTSVQDRLDSINKLGGITKF